MGRNGKQLSLIERTEAVLRVLVGGSVADAAAWLRVRPQQIERWYTPGPNSGPWLHRRGHWDHQGCEYTKGPLCPAEILAGCELFDVTPTNETGEDLRIRQAFNRRDYEVRIGKPRKDPKLVKLMYRERRDLFVDLITKPPPQMPAEVALDQHARVWGMLSERDQGELAPAWDAYQIAAEALYDAKRKIAAIVGIVDSAGQAVES